MSAPESSEIRGSSTGVLGVLRRHPLISFFVLTYAITWLLWSPLVVLGIPVSDPARHAPSWAAMPAIAIGVTGTAIVMIGVTQGRAGLTRYAHRLVSWRAGVHWWAVAILLIPLVSIAVAVVLGTPDAVTALTPAALALYIPAYFQHFFFGPLFEESGWRGFALPRMQKRFGPFLGTLYLSFLWAAWHFFLYAPGWLSEGLGGAAEGAGVFVITVIGMTFIFTWLSNNTRASLLLVILLHGSVDGTNTYIQVLAEKKLLSPAAAENVIGLGLIIAVIVIPIILLIATRGRLGYARYRREAEALDLHPAEGGAVVAPGGRPRNS